MLDPSVSMSSNAQNTSIIGSESPTANQIKNIDRTPNTSTSDQLPPSSLLRSPSAFFTGCDTYLQALKECFSPETDGERKKFLLYGMEGVGKTQICLKFMEQYGKAWFSDIFWIDASSEQRIDLCLRQISKQKKLGSMPSVESALEWLSGRENWLMVFDNADGGLEKFIPPGFWGSILITSRDRGLERITLGTHSLEVTEMGEEDAIALLLKSAMADDNSVNVAIAQKLVAALGYIPLAIDQAGAYVHSCRCGLTQYLELFIKHHAKLISDKEIHGASLSAYGTWDLSIEEIKHRAKGQNSAQSLAAQSALIFLDCFAFLHQDNISGKIFKNAALNFGSRKGERTNGLPQSISLLDSTTLLLYDDDGNWDALQFKAGIEVLLSFSLIRSSGDEHDAVLSRSDSFPTISDTLRLTNDVIQASNIISHSTQLVLLRTTQMRQIIRLKHRKSQSPIKSTHPDTFPTYLRHLPDIFDDYYCDITRSIFPICPTDTIYLIQQSELSYGRFANVAPYMLLSATSRDDSCQLFRNADLDKRSYDYIAQDSKYEPGTLQSDKDYKAPITQPPSDSGYHISDLIATQTNPISTPTLPNKETSRQRLHSQHSQRLYSRAHYTRVSSITQMVYQESRTCKMI